MANPFTMPAPLLQIPITENLTIEMILVEGGSFWMGDAESGRSEEQPVQEVTVPSFYMGKYPVTQEVCQAVMGKNPSNFRGAKRPVEQVSWEDAKVFITKLYEKTGKSFRFPSEAEWEFAARGGNRSEGYLYSGSDKLSQVGWYDKNSDDQTHEVGLLLPNELGLYDMSGNVWEWCEDDWHDSYDHRPLYGRAWIDQPDRASGRLQRGGSYFTHAVGCRAASRSWLEPDVRRGGIGFRLALSFQLTGMPDGLH